MNPEEGELRPQLLDRFALSVEIHGIRAPRERVQIMERNLGFEQDAETFRQEWLAREEELSKRIDLARNLVDKVQHTDRNLLAIASLTASLNVDGHRSDLVILKAARAHAALEGRTHITELDIALAAELALPHRMKGGPMQQHEMGVEEISEHIERLVGSQGESEKTSESEDESPESNETDSKKV
jgi:Mg-chelatase subunit ChlI